MAQIVGVGEATIFRWEMGESVPGAAPLSKIANHLGVKISEIAYFTHDPIPSSWRYISGLTSAEASKKSGVSVYTLSMMENGKEALSNDEIRRLAHCYNIPPIIFALSCERALNIANSITMPTPLFSHTKTSLSLGSLAERVRLLMHYNTLPGEEETTPDMLAERSNGTLTNEGITSLLTGEDRDPHLSLLEGLSSTLHVDINDISSPHSRAIVHQAIAYNSVHSENTFLSRSRRRK